ncbi:MAG: RlmE family RNA methyltransferase, partial [Rhodobacteraceae bacterium]|nr:RlmE family RNA methyltransferase [Paracoccaceae bacterium]
MPGRIDDGGRVRVRTARGRRISSTRWLDRQLNDPFVKQAARDGYRSRSAYKLLDLNDRFQFLKPGATVIDLGSTPGGWSQVAASLVGPLTAGPSGGRVIACDLNDMEPIAGVDFFRLDMHNSDAPARLIASCGGLADAVLSDMAAPSTGHAATDHLRIIGLCERALDLAESCLDTGGAFVAKVLEGGAGNDLQAHIRRVFRQVRTVKPAASRKESSEKYLVATG